MTKQSQTYKFYTLTVDQNGDVEVRTHFSGRLIYRARSFLKAKEWVDAYRAGRAWAMNDALTA
jgi:hypothetical protein